jgi:hypothetical protein
MGLGLLVAMTSPNPANVAGPLLPALLLLLAALAAPAAAEEITTPSSARVTLFDVVLEPETGLARFRFLAPEIATRPFDAVQDDFPWLCAKVALPALASNDWTVMQVIVSLSDRELPLGATDVADVVDANSSEVEADSAAEDAACG